MSNPRNGQLDAQPSSNTRIFSESDFEHLADNEHLRYMDNSKKVGHALIFKNENGEEIALQYAIPFDANKNNPIVRPLENIQSIERFGKHRFLARTPSHTPMYATRYIDVELTEDKHTNSARIACFSPLPKSSTDKGYPEPFWGGADSNATKDLLSHKHKGGRELTIDPASVKFRDENQKKRDQNKVMDDQSAKDAYEEFLDSFGKKLHADIKERLLRAIKAPCYYPQKRPISFKKLMASNHRPEWLHAEGHGLTPLSIDPQRQDNLGAGPKWANTEMMILERIAKWFALNSPETFVKIKPEFEMLLESNLIKKIHFEVTLEEKNRFVKLLQDINPFEKNPIFRKPSDLAQGTAIIHHFLNGSQPIKMDKITAENAHAAVVYNAKPILQATQHMFVDNQPALPQVPIVEQTPVIAQIPIAAQISSAMKNQSWYPTESEYQKSIVEVTNNFQTADYDKPWGGVHADENQGAGFIIENDGIKYIVTNAHVVADSSELEVRFANDRHSEYVAKCKCVSYQCDLALLEIVNPELDKKYQKRSNYASLLENYKKFQAEAKPMTFSERIPSLKSDVFAIGFPIGGSEVKITKGTVSRIEVGNYCISGLDMLHMEIDAALNPGNSGGPVICDDKIIGVAFQIMNSGQSIGYVIPVPIVKHFLTEVFSGKSYRGFPILPITTQALENPTLRQYYKLAPQQAGVRISSVDKLTDAHDKLKADDIILAIDNHPLSNDGTVDIPGIGNCIDMIHLTHMKYIGESVKLTLLRDGNIMQVDVTLDSVPHDTDIIPAMEHDKMPTYYIACGIAFVPATRNYLDGNGCELADLYLEDQGCLLSDAAKTIPNQQKILIHSVLVCHETKGYRDYVNKSVKQINGVKINNIYDVISAIENNQEATHCITVGGGKKIIVEKMSKERHAELLKDRRVYSGDRSEDLKGYIPQPIAEEKASEIQPTPIVVEERAAEIQAIPMKVIAEDISESENEGKFSEAEEVDIDENTIELSDEAAARELEKLKMRKSGVNNYLSYLVGNYGPLDDEENDEDFAPSNVVNDEEGTEDESEEEIIIPKRRRAQGNASNRNSLFHKRKIESDEEDNVQPKKRLRRA
ncbi:MAG: trypsin-like peptidase domain-containing protein [Gammaproteobacteria bacterium]|nr:trypsin-like peptidase domain-containing protein [Gammaproteobacteria bacterium]